MPAMKTSPDSPSFPKFRMLPAMAAAAALLAAGCADTPAPEAPPARADWPDVDLPVLYWWVVLDKPAVPEYVSTASAFRAQVADLAEGGFATVGAREMEAYRTRGEPLPERPCVLWLGLPLRSLLETVEPVLSEAGFCALVTTPSEDLADTAGEEGGRNRWPGAMLSWEELRAAQARGVLRFIPACKAHNAGLGLDEAVALFREKAGFVPEAFVASTAPSNVVRRTSEAHGVPVAFSATAQPQRWGRSSNPLAVTFRPTLGGVQSFRFEATPAGTVRVRHESGQDPHEYAPPLALLLYRPGEAEPVLDVPLRKENGRGGWSPIVRGDTFETALPEGVRLPLEAFVYDDARIVLYARGPVAEAAP